MLVNVSEGDKVDSLLTLKRKTDVNGRPCMNKWCPDSESNQGHGDFQSPALPTELSGQRAALNRIGRKPSTALCVKDVKMPPVAGFSGKGRKKCACSGYHLGLAVPPTLPIQLNAPLRRHCATCKMSSASRLATDTSWSWRFTSSLLRQPS